MTSILYKGKNSVTVEPSTWSFFREDGYNSGFPLLLMDSTLLDLTGDFTLEAIFRFNVINLGTKIQTNGILSADAGDGFPIDGWALFHRRTSTENTLIFHANRIDYKFDFSCSVDTDYHVAITRNNTTLNLWVNGENKKTISGVPTIFNSDGGSFYLGSCTLYSEADRVLNGTIKGIRLSDKVKYTNNFSPPYSW